MTERLCFLSSFSLFLFIMPCTADRVSNRCFQEHYNALENSDAYHILSKKSALSIEEVKAHAAYLSQLIDECTYLSHTLSLNARLKRISTTTLLEKYKNLLSQATENPHLFIRNERKNSKSKK